MKWLFVALCAAVLITAGETLQCHKCVNMFGSCRPFGFPQTCLEGDVCAVKSDEHGTIQQCMDEKRCKETVAGTTSDAKCCTTDLCNTL